jgi:hypothetical protein
VTTKSSAVPEIKYLILTSPDHIRLDGDTGALGSLGLTGGVTHVSTEAEPASTGGFFSGGMTHTEAVAEPVTYVSTEAVAEPTSASTV